MSFGRRGYVLKKSNLSAAQQEKIRDDLTIWPQIDGAPPGSVQCRYIYRESPTKMFVPYYYGLAQYGPPETVTTPHGVDISVPFVGSLRANQQHAVDAFFAHLDGKEVGGGLLELPCAYGKTVLSLNIISRLGKKVLVLVHKGFLVNQWIARIRQFLPAARVGIIQGTNVQVDGCDIVIGMMQSISKREYDPETFNEFGFVVIDEVHRSSSASFLNALFKVVPRFHLGLSARIERKDGTSRAFRMFIGDVIFRGERDQKRDVVVRSIRYSATDSAYTHIPTMANGNVSHSALLCQVSDYEPRTQFILQVLADLMKEDPTRQILVLSLKIDMANYLFRAIEERGIATVGYYLGGMKEHKLAESESKQVILATYAMAAEGLDIKTLSALVFATPMTDIMQSVGRILRDAHSNSVVVDIVDIHQVFRNQWKKRLAFYQGESYDIHIPPPGGYTGQFSAWRKMTNCATKRDIDSSKCLI